MEKILKAWNYLSGKKTVIGAICKSLADILVTAGQAEYAPIFDYIGNFLISTGLIHKGVKATK